MCGVKLHSGSWNVNLYAKIFYDTYNTFSLEKIKGWIKLCRNMSPPQSLELCSYSLRTELVRFVVLL